MKKFLSVFFITLGVIFFVIILAGIYFFITDPYNLKPLFFNDDVSGDETTTLDLGAEDKNPLLSPKQEKALEVMGINPEEVPSAITLEQEACFVNAIGADRVAEIKAGDSPSAGEILKGQSCI